MLTALFTGTLAGVVHVASGPDHLAAIAPLSIERWRRAWQLGLHWGLGHASGVLFLGVCSILLREAIPVELISSVAERFVGVVLISIGLWGFRQGLRNHVHTHEHTHDGGTHAHLHIHGNNHSHGEQPSTRHEHGHAAFGIGSIHGLAGGSHLLSVLPALLFASKTSGLLYLVAYGIGTVGAMVVFAWSIGLASRKFSAQTPLAYKWVSCVCSGAAICVGGYWLAA